MDTLELQETKQVPIVVKEKRWSRLVVLIGLFLVLLYLYTSLTTPAKPGGFVPSEGITPVFSIYGWGNERLSSPNGVATDGAGNIYIADTANHRVVSFDGSGNFRFVIGKKANNIRNQLKEGPIVFPLGVAVAGNGDIFISSMERGSILIYDSSGSFKREVGAEEPIALTIGGQRLYVTTPGEILVYSLKGDLINRWGEQGSRIKQFQYPNGIVSDSKSNLFVSDTQNSRIQIFNRKSDSIGWLGTPPNDMNDSRRTFGLNMGITMDSNERVYVVDAFRHSIHAFDYEGNKIGEFGSKGEFEGQFNYPSGITYLGARKFAIADKWNDRVQVVRLGTPTTAVEVGEQVWSWFPYALLLLLTLTVVYLKMRNRRARNSEESNSNEAGYLANT